MQKLHDTELQDAFRGERSDLAAHAETLDQGASRTQLARAIDAEVARGATSTGGRRAGRLGRRAGTQPRSRLLLVACGTALVAGALFTAVALQPSGGDGPRVGTTTTKTGTTGGAKTTGGEPAVRPRAGALAGLRLSDASAAQVLVAAGSSAAARTESAPTGAGAWGYRRLFVQEGTDDSFRISETWTSLEDGSTWDITHNTYAGEVKAGREYSIYHRRNDGDDSLSASFRLDGAGGIVETDRTQQLDQGVTETDQDVRRLIATLDDVTTVEEARVAVSKALGLKIQGDSVCEGDICHGSSATSASTTSDGLPIPPAASGPATANGQAQWDQQARAVIASTMQSRALPTEATLALYGLLAQMQGAKVVGIVDTGRGAPGVGVRFPGQLGMMIIEKDGSRHAPAGDIWVFTRATGQLAAVVPEGRMDGYREWSEAVGTVGAPGASSTACREVPALCAKLDELVAFTASDPKWTGPSGTKRSNDIPMGQPGADATMQERGLELDPAWGEGCGKTVEDACAAVGSATPTSGQEQTALPESPAPATR